MTDGEWVIVPYDKLDLAAIARDLQTPTQVRHPNRAMWRTAVQVGVALLTLVPYMVADMDVPTEGWVAQVVGVAMAASRIMALPQVVTFTERHLPWLAPAGGIRTTDGHG
jgi:hypothetical protein